MTKTLEELRAMTQQEIDDACIPVVAVILNLSRIGRLDDENLRTVLDYRQLQIGSEHPDPDRIIELIEGVQAKDYPEPPIPVVLRYSRRRKVFDKFKEEEKKWNQD